MNRCALNREALRLYARIVEDIEPPRQIGRAAGHALMVAHIGSSIRSIGRSLAGDLRRGKTTSATGLRARYS